MAEQLYKRCPKCETIKLLGDFWLDRRQKDGFSVSCRGCLRVDPERRRLSERRNYKKRRERYYEQIRARQLLADALHAGKMQRPKHCEDCGTEGKVHGHHEDYGKPLEVEWLCRPCHEQRHAS
jgi:hypothetical protein